MSAEQDVPAEVQADLDRLLNVVLDVAQEQLATVGEFYPFAVALDHTAQSRLVAADMGGDEHPDAADVLKRCVEGLVSARADLRASALATDVRLPAAGSDAVRVDLEHVDGLALRVFLLYAKGPANDVVYGEIKAEQGEPVVWG